MLHLYSSLVQKGILQRDASQLRVLTSLESLLDRLQGYSEQVHGYNKVNHQYSNAKAALQQEIRRELAEQQKENQPGFWQRFLPSNSQQQRQSARDIAAAIDSEVLRRLGPPPTPPAVKGLYLWGSVGSGKSLLMDMFYSQATAQQLLPHMQRLHFNTALIQVHSVLGKLEKERQQHEQFQAAEYAAEVAAMQEQQAATLQAEQDRELQEHQQGFPSLPWLQLRKLDPGYQRQKRAMLARLAVRREQRDRLARDSSEHIARLAGSNSQLVQLAAVAMLTGQAGSALGSISSAKLLPILHQRMASLLCFDELQVGDPFNAVALKGILEWLFGSGSVLVSTSNRPPWELNRHGLQEDLFDHLVSTLMQHCEVVEMSAHNDYRRRMRAQQQPDKVATARSDLTTYFHPLGASTTKAMESVWQQILAGRQEYATTIPVHFGRTLQVPRACGRAAWFTFRQLCAANLGSADYNALSHYFDTILLSDVPAMSLKIRDQARRFIVLLDELYNEKCRLICSAEVAPDSLFAGTDSEEPIIDLEAIQFETEAEGNKLRRNLLADGSVAPVAGTKAALAAAQALLGGAEEKFMFARAVSRLHEMQSAPYMAGRHASVMLQQNAGVKTNV